VLKKLQLLWIVLTLSLIFFISGFNFETFTDGSHSYYASEIVCSGPSRDLNCSIQLQDDFQLFRGSINEPTQLPNYGERYTSSSFANFLNLFITSTDSLQTVLLKIFSIKSLVAAYLVAYSLFLVKKFDIVRQLATKLFLVAFCFPYLLFGMAGVYPAPIATLAVIPILITLKIFEREKKLFPQTKLLLFANFFVCLSVVMSNRFETTAFLIFGISVWGIYQYFKKQKHNLLTVSFVSIFCFSLFMGLNPTLRNIVLKSLSGKFRVLTDDELATSKVVEEFGILGLSISGPVTFIDNTSRNLLNMLFQDSTFSFLKVVTLLPLWIPIFVLLFHALRALLVPLLRRKSFSKKSVRERIPALLTLGIFLALPTFARTVWFLWYSISLLAIFVFFTDHLENAKKSLKLMVLVAITANAFYFLLVVLKLGNLEVVGITISSSLQIVLGFSLGLATIKLITIYLSSPPKSLAKDKR
jgi:hypothetical protein